MAKLVTDTITITLSKMVPNKSEDDSLLTSDLLEGLQAVISELAGEGVMVEIE